MHLATAWFGTVLLDGETAVAKALFPQDAASIADRLLAMHKGDVLPEERSLAPDGPFDVSEARLLKLPGARLVADAPRLAARMSEFGANRPLLHDAAMEFGRLRYRDVQGGRDQHVLMAVDAVDDLAAVANEVSERLREWYGLHYPELNRVERHEEFVGLVAEHGTREAIQAARPGLPVESIGAPLPGPEAEAVRQLARLASRVYSTRAELESYLEKTMPELAPNLARLLGASLAARIVRLAGGLDSLARMPAGTIQTLGAEKALFRHLKEGKRGPKHGVLLQHPLLHRAPRHHRGPLARALAGKVALAARADALTKHDLARGLQRDLDVRAREIDRERGPFKRAPRERVDRGPPPRGAPPRGPPGAPPRGPPGGGQGFRPPRRDERPRTGGRPRDDRGRR